MNNKKDNVWYLIFELILIWVLYYLVPFSFREFFSVSQHILMITAFVLGNIVLGKKVRRLLR